MRERGDLTGLAAAGAGPTIAAADLAATATESVAACICRGLRRQYAIEFAALIHWAGPGRSQRITSRSCRRETALLFHADVIILDMGTHPSPENASKSKGPDKCPGLW
jgi:hypothetical protein